MIINSSTISNRDLLVICPTRERPYKLARMYESYSKTICGKTGIVLCVDVDDETHYDYNCAISVSPHKNNTRIINGIFNKYPDYKYYMVINDDITFDTIGWDVSMMGRGINYPNDRTERNFPTFSIIEGNIARALGWLQMPNTEYLYADNVWNHIGNMCNIMRYHNDVYITHNHPFINNTSHDKISEKTNSIEQYNKDFYAFSDWLVNQSWEDIRKVRDLYE